MEVLFCWFVNYLKLENIDKIPLCDVPYLFLLLLDMERPKA